MLTTRYLLTGTRSCAPPLLSHATPSTPPPLAGCTWATRRNVWTTPAPAPARRAVALEQELVNVLITGSMMAQAPLQPER